MTIWFTADHHFGHENIIKYCNRPFGSIGEMDAELILRWNDCVSESDTVYHLGDFTLSELYHARWYFSRLNGYILILDNGWHHDKRWIRHAKEALSLPGDVNPITTGSGYYLKILPPLDVLEFHPPVVLCHYPLARWDRRHYGAWHLHGHTHGRYQCDGFCMDAGVDANDFRPVSLGQVGERMMAKGWHENWKEYE
jgi:calcineurin-like phosphoesterase family protein